MKYLSLLFFILVACGSGKQTKQSDPLDQELPSSQPMPFNQSLIPAHSIVHRGIFSNDLQQYYFTISDSSFANFTVMVSQKENDQWAAPTEAFFNSQYSDHGMSFSPDGSTLVFTSTRPVDGLDQSNTWQIWRSELKGEVWTEPIHLEIPQLSSKHMLQPTVAPNGTVYFQASNLDYSEMAIYYSVLQDGDYKEAQKLEFENLDAVGYCTPYVSANGEYLLFATIGESLEMYISKSQGDSEWSAPVKLPASINENSQGNPYLTPDLKHLLYASDKRKYWDINRVSTESFLKAND